MNETEQKTNVIPNPGSSEARSKGCLCPILDNAHGVGYLGNPGRWVFREDCPLHKAMAESDAG